MSSANPDRTSVLVLIKGLGLGGAERLIAAAATVWDLARFEYSVAYVLPWKDHLVESIASHGTTVDCIGGKGGLDLRTRARLRGLIADRSPDIVHAHLPSAGILARVSTSVPIVYTEHNVSSSYRHPTRELNRLTYGRNRAVIAVSASVADSLRGFPGPDPIVIPNGVSVDPDVSPESVREQLGLGPDDRLVVHVGNIRPHKGHSNLIAATSILAKELPGVTVISIGAEKNDGDLERVRAEAEAAGAGVTIRFLGRRDDAQSFLAAADVVVNPSDYEGLPVTLLEALSFARPVVATDVGGVSEIVEHGSTGLLVPPGDPEALAASLYRALTDVAAPEWGRAGRTAVLTRHGIDSMVRSYEDVYQEVLGG